MTTDKFPDLVVTILLTEPHFYWYSVTALY